MAESPTDADLVLAGIGPGNLMLGGLYRSTDRGATWQSVDDQNLSRVPVDAIAFAPDGTVYVGTAWYLWKSTDDGETWVQHALPSTEDWVRSVVVDPTDPSTVWVGVGPQVLQVDGRGLKLDRPDPAAGEHDLLLHRPRSDGSRPGVRRLLRCLRLEFETLLLRRRRRELARPLRGAARQPDLRHRPRRRPGVGGRRPRIPQPALRVVRLLRCGPHVDRAPRLELAGSLRVGCRDRSREPERDPARHR